MKLLQRIYAFYGVVNFFFWYLWLFPCYAVLVNNRRWHIYTKPINQLFSYMIFWGIGIPIIKKNKGFNHQKGNQYIFVANHTSYLDVPLLSATSPVTTIFIGKRSLAKVPLFGYMYKRLHILIDRHNRRDMYESLVKSRDVLARGMSLGIFAEGGIRTANPPAVADFKEGAFRLAIEQKVPIVPVTIVNNWRIFWNTSFLLKWYPARIIYHAPISTQDMTLKDIEILKHQTKQVIEQELILT